jgi:P4 family phage/plasmid primase-like protien
MDNLEKFLFNHKSENKLTHVSLFNPRGKYYIEKKNDFWKYYYSSDNAKGIAELSSYTTHLPILIDYDITLEKNNQIHFLEEMRQFYNLEQVKNIIRIYQKVLKDILKNVKDEHLICILLEKKAYEKKRNNQDVYKNGFHLHFPFIFLNKIHHENDLLPRVKLELKKLNIEELPNSMNFEECLDKCYIKNPWLLYGGQKESHLDPYLVTSAFDADTKELENWKNVFESYILYDDSNNQIPIELENIDYYLPQIFSIHLNNRYEYIYNIKDDLPLLSHNKVNSIVKIQKMHYEEEIKNETDLIENLLDCLTNERSNDHNEWMHIGWILYNIYNGSQKGFDLWCRFSKRSSKYDEQVCIYEWSRMIKKNLTIGSLKFLAKKDNPQEFYKIMQKSADIYYEKNIKLEGAHADLALILFQKYEQEFVCGSIQYKQWFRYENHIWTKDEVGVSLSKKISDELVDDYEEIAKQAFSKLKQCSSDEECEAGKKKIKIICKLIKNLKSAPYKSHIMTESMALFYKRDFLSSLDTDPYLIGFQNGIYDLHSHIFREGKPSDNISLKMPIQYKCYDMNSTEILEIENYFQKIFPDKEVRDYFLDTSSEIFIGGNFNKIVQIWSGEGDNGKSITQSLFEQMLGPYNVKLPTSLITGKRSQSSAACPELVRAGNGVRLAMLQEPDQKDTINIGMLKELSGNDTFFARGLYKEGQEITPLFKLVVVCNEPPKLTYSDKAAWNRIKIIPFESTFTDDAPSTFEEQLQLKQFPKDTKFKDKIPHMIEPLAYFLLHRLKNKPMVHKIPLKVMIATENYKQKNDVFKQYISEWIEFKEDKFCKFQEMFQSFRDWFRESFPDQSCPDRNEFLDYFVRIWGPMTNREGWTGKQIRCIVDYS